MYVGERNDAIYSDQDREKHRRELAAHVPHFGVLRVLRPHTRGPRARCRHPHVQELDIDHCHCSHHVLTNVSFFSSNTQLFMHQVRQIPGRTTRTGQHSSLSRGARKNRYCLKQKSCEKTIHIEFLTKHSQLTSNPPKFNVFKCAQ